MMLSRMAEALYWMARNLERADNASRLLEMNLLHLVEAEEGGGTHTQWNPYLEISGSEALFEKLYGKIPLTSESAVAFLTQDKNNPNSILNVLQSARENARVVRDCISKEMWENINHLWLWASDRLKTPLSTERAPAFCRTLRHETAGFDGLTASTMMQGESYSFYRMGLFLERADMSARILDVKYYILLPDVSKVGSALDYYQWMALLKSLSGFEAFRQTYQAGLRPSDVAEFVVLCAEFPRSLRFCVERMGNALAQMSGGRRDNETYRAWRNLHEALTRQTAASIFQQGLHEFLAEILQLLARMNEALQAQYFEAHLGERLAILN
jgi:uncharacterized alpha-E superfamily protein